MKKEKIILACILLILLMPISTLSADIPNSINDDWTIDGNKVYTDTKDFYLSAEPHTLGSSGWVTFEYNCKTNIGNFELVWGFDKETAKPSKTQTWEYYEHFYSESNWVIDGHNTSKNGTKIPYGHTEWNNYSQMEWDWKDISTLINTEKTNYNGFDNWYSKQAKTSKTKTLHKIRAWIDIPFGTNGKYWFCLKPTGTSLTSSIGQNKFYTLDPWWNATYINLRKITIDHDYINEDLTNFPVLVVLNSTIGTRCDNGKSIRFTLDNITLLNHEIEKWNSAGDSFIWVNVTAISSSVDTVFYMYYNNSNTTYGQNMHDTWNDDYLMVWHLNATSRPSVIDSTGNGLVPDADNDMHYGQGGIIHHGIRVDGDGGMRDTYNSNIDGADYSVTCEAWFNINVIQDNWDHIFGTNGYVMSINYFTPYFLLRGDPGGWRSSGFTIVDDTWYHIVGRYNATHISIWINGSEEASFSYTGAIDYSNHYMSSWFGTDNYLNHNFHGWADELRISSNARSDAWIKASYENQNQTTGFLTIGAEEEEQINIITLSNEDPTSGSTNLEIGHNYSINIGVFVNSTIADTNCALRTNASGTWTTLNYTANINYLTGGNVNSSMENLSYATKYYWSANVTDGTDWLNETYNFSTIDPFITLSNEMPINKSMYNLRTPTLSIDATHAKGIITNITIQTNATGIWTTIYTIEGSLENGTFSIATTAINQSDTWYYWCVNASSNGNWTNATYKFKVAPSGYCIPELTCGNYSKDGGLYFYEDSATDPWYSLWEWEYNRALTGEITTFIMPVYPDNYNTTEDWIELYIDGISYGNPDFINNVSNYSQWNISHNLTAKEPVFELLLITNGSGREYIIMWQKYADIDDDGDTACHNQEQATPIIPDGVYEPQITNWELLYSFIFEPEPQLQAWFNYSINGTGLLFWDDSICLGINSIDFYIWQWGDGAWGTGSPEIHKYHSEGCFNVNYNIESIDHQLTNTVSRTVCTDISPEVIPGVPFLLQMDWYFLLWAIYLLIFIAIIKLLVSEVKRMWGN